MLKTDQDIIVGDRCQIDYGISGKDVVICEFCKVNGNIIADGDVRIDNWCEVTGDIVVGEDAYLGEGVKVRGKLIVRGDLDIGDNVQIERGFEAKGWIAIRNPMPVIVYIVMYLVALLGIEREDELNDFIARLCGEESACSTPLMIPAGTVLNMETFAVPDSMTIGSHCRLHGNIRAASIAILGNTTVFGSLQAKDAVTIAEGAAIHGDVRTDGDVSVEKDVHILGDVSCRKLALHEDARVDGVIRAPQGLKIARAA